MSWDRLLALLAALAPFADALAWPGLVLVLVIWRRDALRRVLDEIVVRFEAGADIEVTSVKLGGRRSAVVSGEASGIPTIDERPEAD